jgi:hypothetical protein
MFTKKNLLLTILAAAAATLLIISQAAWSDQDRNSAKLDGTWVARVPGMPAQWNYVLTPAESSGRRASVYGIFTVPIPGFLYGLPEEYEPEQPSAFWGYVALTGRNEAEGKAIWWGTKSAVPGNPAYPFKQVVHIGVDSFTVSFTAQGKTQVTHRMEFYDPSADADGDGLPDSGQAPVFSAPSIISLDTSLTQAALGLQQ